MQAQAADIPRGNGAFWLICYAHEPETAEKKLGKQHPSGVKCPVIQIVRSEKCRFTAFT